MIEKPTTMLMDEFKEKFIELLNNSKLPAWVVLYLLDPFIKQLQELDQAVKVQEREEYQKALEEENQKIQKGIESLTSKELEEGQNGFN